LETLCGAKEAFVVMLSGDIEGDVRKSCFGVMAVFVEKRVFLD
jgi:hypothetical protein